MAVTAKGTPYVESSDLVANYPGVSLALANHIDTIGKVLQVVTKTQTLTTVTNSTTFVTTGLNITITPRATTSKILVTFTANVAQDASNDDTVVAIFRGTVAGTNLGTFAGVQSSGTNTRVVISPSISDLPSTIAATTYTVGFKVSGGTGRIGVGNTVTMTAMEISA